jgi:hypothetical protein
VASPYEGARTETWSSITDQVIRAHPLSPQLLVKTVLTAWNEIFESRVGSLQIGKDIFPQPQIMGFFLHELIPVVIARVAPEWRRGDVGAGEKDLHFTQDAAYSVEIKTSSNPKQIFGNRSYAQVPTARSRDKAGYYLAVNFSPFKTSFQTLPPIVRIRFGWLDHTDWIGQTSATGQQARLTRDADRFKLKDILDQR